MGGIGEESCEEEKRGVMKKAKGKMKQWVVRWEAGENGEEEGRKVNGEVGREEVML